MKKLFVFLVLVSASCFGLEERTKEIICIITKKIKVEECPKFILDTIEKRAKNCWPNNVGRQRAEIELAVEGYSLMQEFKKNINNDSIYAATLKELEKNCQYDFYFQYETMISHINDYVSLHALKKKQNGDCVFEAFVKEAERMYPDNYAMREAKLVDEIRSYLKSHPYR